jgi:hypothetical protein
MVREPQGPRQSIKHTREDETEMKFFDSHWERVRLGLNPATLRVGLAILSLVALVFGGTASEHWT